MLISVFFLSMVAADTAEPPRVTLQTDLETVLVVGEVAKGNKSTWSKQELMPKAIEVDPPRPLVAIRQGDAVVIQHAEPTAAKEEQP